VLLPGEWARAYRAHIEGKGKEIPSQLNTQVLLCPAHGGLLYNPIPHNFRPFEPSPSPYHLMGSKEGELGFCTPELWDSLKRNGAYFNNVDTDALLVKMTCKEKCEQGTTREERVDRIESDRARAARRLVSCVLIGLSCVPWSCPVSVCRLSNSR
jgi:hypothetical protein